MRGGDEGGQHEHTFPSPPATPGLSDPAGVRPPQRLDRSGVHDLPSQPGAFRYYLLFTRLLYAIKM